MAGEGAERSLTVRSSVADEDTHSLANVGARDVEDVLGRQSQPDLRAVGLVWRRIRRVASTALFTSETTVGRRLRLTVGK